MLRSILIVLAVLAVGACRESHPAPPEAVQVQRSDPQWGNNPEAEAKKAAAAGRYGLIWIFGFKTAGVIGVICNAPVADFRPGDSDLIAAILSSSDLPSPAEQMESKVRLPFADRYNRAMVDEPGFPYADICQKEAGDGDPYLSWGQPLPGRPGQIRTLADAARLGDLTEVRRRLTAGELVDRPDGFGMTPLGWATARGQEAVALHLIQNGANPILGPRGMDMPTAPLLLAVRFKRNDLFEAMLRRLDMPMDRDWSTAYLDAAANGDNAVLLARFLKTAPETPYQRAWLFQGALAGRAHQAAEVLLATGGISRDALLEMAVQTANPLYVEKALRLGANPNLRVDNQTVLILAMESAHPDALATARLLIDYGARVNAGRTGEENALQRILRGGGRNHVGWTSVHERLQPADTTPMLRLLLRSGASVKAPDSRGRPVAFQAIGADEPGGRVRSPPNDWLPLLKAAGMDINARWQGHTALDLALAAPGDNGALIAEMKRLGARPGHRIPSQGPPGRG